jgi:nuclear cap-binding protein subunit 2
MAASTLYTDLELVADSEYYDRRSGLAEVDYKQRLKTSTTLYVGNLSFYTQESQLLTLFSQVGQLKNLHMGLNNKTYKPCGFCFVEFHTREEARLAIDCFNLFLFDGKRIRIDWDYGF